MSQLRLGWNKILDRVVENVFDLQFVLVIFVTCAEQAKFFGEIETFGKIFWCDEIERDFDAVENVKNLMWCTGGNENSVAFVLNECVAVDVFFLQAFAE